MLAYVFWHRPRQDADSAQYELSQTVFHRSLAEEPPDGFIASAVARVGALPWLAGEGYEDWYLVRDYASLGDLADAATGGAHGPSHAGAASMFGAGTAGLYGLVEGGADPSSCLRAGHATWLERPVGEPYPPLQALSEEPDVSASLWRRQLVLGPAPELCLLHDRQATPRTPAGWDRLEVPREAL